MRVFGACVYFLQRVFFLDSHSSVSIRVYPCLFYRVHSCLFVSIFVQAHNVCSTFRLSTQEGPEGIRGQEKPGEAMRSQDEPGTRRTAHWFQAPQDLNKLWSGAGLQEEPGAPRKSQKGEGARRNQEMPGARDQQNHTLVSSSASFKLRRTSTNCDLVLVARRGQEHPGKNRRSKEKPGETRRSQEKPGGTRGQENSTLTSSPPGP